MTGYEKRKENLEKAHGVIAKDWDVFLEVIDPQPNEKILDLMGGSGAVALKLYDFARERNIGINAMVMDAYPTQLIQVPTYLDKCIGDIRNIPLEDNSYDKVAVKMGLHELPLEEQKDAVREVYRITKPGGKFVLWMAGLKDRDHQEIFQWLIREKDKIAGFDDFVKKRYFPTIEETRDYLKRAGFRDINIRYNNTSRMNTKDRLNGDFGGDCQKLKEYNQLIRSRFREVDNKLGAKDLGGPIEISHPITFLEAYKT